MLGGHSVLDPPDPFPNSEVKRLRADDSVHYACESRSPPGSLQVNPSRIPGEGFCFCGAPEEPLWRSLWRFSRTLIPSRNPSTRFDQFETPVLRHFAPAIRWGIPFRRKHRQLARRVARIHMAGVETSKRGGNRGISRSWTRLPFARTDRMAGSTRAFVGFGRKSFPVQFGNPGSSGFHQSGAPA